LTFPDESHIVPRYQDLAQLFSQVLGKTYSRDVYEEHFSVRINKRLDKTDRILHIYRQDVPDTLPGRLTTAIHHFHSEVQKP
jgi:GTP-dependent phosphoenolpyruvate carboxykinase